MSESARPTGALREFGSHPPLSPPPPDEDVNLAQYVTALQRRWKFLVVATLVGGLTGAVASTLRPVLYEGVTTLLVVPPSRATTVLVNPATFRAMLENGTIALQVINELRLTEPPHQLTAQTFLERNLAVEEVRGSNIMRVRVTLGDPQIAADASRRVAHKALALAQQLNEQEGTSLQEQLKNHLTDANNRMALAEKNLLAYQQEAQLELLKEDTQAMLKERGDLLKLLIAIESEKARLESAEQEIKRQDRVLSVTRAPAIEEALRRAQQQEDRNAGKASKAGSSADPEMLDLTNPFMNPVYQTLDFQIATSRSRLAALEQERRQLVDVRKLGGSELARLKELYRRQIELTRLQTTFDLTKKVFSDLTVRYEQSRTESLGSSPQLQLVDEAIAADRPLSRRRGQWAALGAATGFLAAGLIALLLDSRQRQVRAAST